jgi:phosphate transport system substrate-binding protein
MRKILVIAVCALAVTSCDNYFKNDYTDNSPTSGKLIVFCEEGLSDQIESQIYAFESKYANAKVEMKVRSDADAVQALYNDSCKAIVISRELSPAEKKQMASKNYQPQFSNVAYSGVALITNAGTKVSKLTTVQLHELLTKPFVCTDSIDANCKITVVFESNRSSVVYYLRDSLLKGSEFSGNCRALKNSLEVINHVANTPNAIGFIDFAWLSDVDDSLYKANAGKIKFIPIGRGNGTYYEPNQSSFKTGEYPLARKVYVYRHAPEFSLAKGFEAFVAGPVGQTIFLKQGLLPTKQQERSIKVNLGNSKEEE